MNTLTQPASSSVGSTPVCPSSLGPYSLSVSRRDIADGIPGDCKNCVIAQAFRRLFPGCYINVSGDEIYFREAYGRMYYTLKPSREAFEFMFRFDKRLGVVPTTLNFQVVSCIDV